VVVHLHSFVHIVHKTMQVHHHHSKPLLSNKSYIIHV